MAGCGGVALVALLFVFFSGGVVSSRDLCQTQGCRQYERLLGEAMNVSVQPCESFTQFVCGGLHRRNQLGVAELVVTGAIETMTRIVDVTYLPKTGQDSAQRGLAIYRSCAALLQGRQDQLSGVREALREAGVTWPLRPTVPDIPRVIVATSLRLGWDVMFRVVPLWHAPQHTSRILLLNSGRTIIEVLNKTSTPIALPQRRNHFEVLRENFLQSPSDDKETLPGRVTTFEEVSDAEKAVIAALRRAYYRAEVLPPVPVQAIMDVPSLGLSRARWEETLSRFGLRVTAPPSELELRTANPDYVTTFLKLWEHLGNDRMHLFVSWCTVQVGALFANKELIASFYGGDMITANYSHTAFCFSRAFAVSGPQFFAGYNRGHQVSSTLGDARSLAQSVRNSFHRRLLRWSGHQENVTVVANWSSLDTLLGLIDGGIVKPRGQGDFGKMFPDLDENSLLSNLRKSSSLVAVSSGEYNEESDVEVTAVSATLSMLTFSATFYGRPDFQLMPYAIVFPFFDLELVPGVNFGGFGAEVAKALGVLTLKSYRLSGPLRSGGPVRNCFAASPFAQDTNLFVALAEALGFGALVDAYDSSASSDPRFGMRLSGFRRFTGEQLLFISLCLNKCRRGDSGRTPASICNLPLMYLPEFSRYFQCAPGTPMNPTEKCELF